MIENNTDENNNADVENSTWKMWTKLRTMCEESSKLALALELTDDLPSENVIDRWLAEPIKCVILPTSIFLTNKNGYPVLSKAHQRCIYKLFQVK